MPGGGTPSQVWGRGYPISGLGGGTLARSGWWGGGYPIPCLGGYPISGLGRGYPISGLVGGTPCLGGPHLRSRGVPHVQGVPHVWLGGNPISAPPPPHCTEQHSEHLLCGGRCASCVHAGGLSCLLIKNSPKPLTIATAFFSNLPTPSFVHYRLTNFFPWHFIAIFLHFELEWFNLNKVADRARSSGTLSVA